MVEYNEVIFSNVNKLREGSELKYKEMCTLLEQPTYGGNQKIKQLKEFSRYFNFEYNKSLKRYVIIQVYQTPLPESLEASVNSIYSSHVKSLLLSYLIKHASGKGDDGVLYISSQKLYLALGMINQNYITMQSQESRRLLKKELQNTCDELKSINEKNLDYYIDSFYKRSRRKLASILESSLSSLESGKYLTYCKSYHLQEEVFTKSSDIGEKLSERYTTDEETADLFVIERLVMEEMGFENERDILFSKAPQKYYEEVFEVAKEKWPNLTGMYRCLKIITRQCNLELALSKEQETRERRQLNQKIIEYVDNQAIKNFEKAQEEPDPAKRFTRSYLDAQLYLSNRLIKIES